MDGLILGCFSLLSGFHAHQQALSSELNCFHVNSGCHQQYYRLLILVSRVKGIQRDLHTKHGKLLRQRRDRQVDAFDLASCAILAYLHQHAVVGTYRDMKAGHFCSIADLYSLVLVHYLPTCSSKQKLGEHCAVADLVQPVSCFQHEA